MACHFQLVRLWVSQCLTPHPHPTTCLQAWFPSLGQLPQKLARSSAIGWGLSKEAGLGPTCLTGGCSSLRSCVTSGGPPLLDPLQSGLRAPVPKTPGSWTIQRCSSFPQRGQVFPGSPNRPSRAATYPGDGRRPPCPLLPERLGTFPSSKASSLSDRTRVSNNPRQAKSLGKD
jgi:hypothetical protein